ncbi:MAG: hypothetical protein V1870_03325 [Candidatus Aenigmatarchaeota archaeon]
MVTLRKGYRVERNIRIIFKNSGWRVMRAGASLGEADLVCFKTMKCILLQVKSTKKKTFYYYDYMKNDIEGFPFYLVVDFGYGVIRVVQPKKIIKTTDGVGLKQFINNL